MGGGVLLEVGVTRPRDVVGAQTGGADRLLLQAPTQQRPADRIGRSPDLQTVSAVVREASVPVRVRLRLNDGYTTTGGEFTRLVGLAEEFVGIGAEGVSFGFLDGDLEVDTRTCAALAEAIAGIPWTFHRAFDSSLDPARSWRRVGRLPGLTAVESAGSPEGLARGYDDLLSAAGSDPDVARLLMPAGGLLAEHVPWFLRAGVRQFQLGPQARPGGSDKAFVDAALVRSWRRLLDDSASRGQPA